MAGGGGKRKSGKTTRAGGAAAGVGVVGATRVRYRPTTAADSAKTREEGRRRRRPGRRDGKSELGAGAYP